jgi:hypothetical protein
MENLRRYNWLILSCQVIFNLFLGWMLLSTANTVFLVPFPYRERLPLFLLIAALGFTASCISGTLYLYRRSQRLVISGILKTPPALVWCVISSGLAVFFGISMAEFPNQWSTY